MAHRFLGEDISYEAKQALRTLTTLDVNTFAPVLEAVLAHTLGSPANSESARRLQLATTLDSTTLGALFTGLEWLLRLCMRSSLKTKALHAELTDARMHPPLMDAFLQAVERGCVHVFNLFLTNEAHIPMLYLCLQAFRSRTI